MRFWEYKRFFFPLKLLVVVWLIMILPVTSVTNKPVELPRLTSGAFIWEECRNLVWAAASSRWAQISPAGGALLPGWDPAGFSSRSLRSALDFLVRDHGHFLLHFGRAKPRSDVIEADASSWESKVSVREFAVRPARRVFNIKLVELLICICHRGDGSVTAGWMTLGTVAFQSEVEHGAAAVWTLLRLWVKVLALFCVCQRGKRGFIIVNFVLICIHRGLPSQTHQRQASQTATIALPVSVYKMKAFW